MIAYTDSISARRASDPHLSEAQRSMIVDAKLALCLEPQFDQVSVTVVGRDGEVSSWAQAGDLVADLDQLQYGLGEGPCIDSIRRVHSVVVPHLQRDGRWQRYVPAAAELGLRAQVSAPLRGLDRKTLGALNMYSTTSSDVGVTAPLVAEVLARQVASTMADERHIEDLTAALDSCTTIGQATGVVMAQLEIDADHAMAYLRRVTVLRDETLAQVADEIVRTRDLPAVRQE